MAILELYDHELWQHGWIDVSFVTPGWFDHELGTDSPIPLAIMDVDIFLDGDEFFAGLDGPVQLPPQADGTPRPTLPPQWQPHITVEVYHPAIFLDDDLIFHPVAMRKIDPPDMYLKNEVRRVR